MENNYNEEPKRRNPIGNKSKFLTFIFGLIPGAGQMYLGYMNRGLAFMVSFGIVIFISGLLNFIRLDFLMPIIWAYSFFDTFHIYNGKEVSDDIDFDFDLIKDKIKLEYIGKLLIVIGIIGLVSNVGFPLVVELFDQFIPNVDWWRVRNYIQTTIVALVFIYGGYRIIQHDRDGNNYED